MPPAHAEDDALFGEPDTGTTERENEPMLSEDGAFEIEHPVRFDELGEQDTPGRRDPGQSFSISKESLTAPVREAPPTAPARPPTLVSPRADDESDLPWAEPEPEPIELDQESEPDTLDDDSIEAAEFAERHAPALPPPAPPSAPSMPRPAARPAEPPRPVAAKPAADAAHLASPQAPALDARALHESLEKVAWEAFGPLSEQIMQEVVKRVEAIAWEVVPQLAERLIREEIAQLKKSE
jgi:hypothetical protein